MKSILRITLGFITLIFLFLLGCVGFFVVNKEGSFLGFTIFTASGKSMTPTIEAGDILLVRKDPYYSINDIIVYKNDEGMIVCHRIVQKDDISYITKGDDNKFIDGYNPTIEDIYGKMVFNVINIQTINEYKYALIGGLIIIPIILFIIGRCLNVRTDNNRISG